MTDADLYKKYRCWDTGPDLGEGRVVDRDLLHAQRFAHHWDGTVQTAWVTSTCNIWSLLASINVMTPRLEDTSGKGRYRKLIIMLITQALPIQSRVRHLPQQRDLRLSFGRLPDNPRSTQRPRRHKWQSRLVFPSFINREPIEPIRFLEAYRPASAERR
jgi:hypothetical protein